MTFPRALASGLLAAASLALSACRGVVSAYGGDVSAAKANADAVAAALEYRFTAVARTPKFANARMRLGRYALAPSKLVGDTALWTSANGSGTAGTRDLELSAGLVTGRYTFNARPNVAPPRTIGDERHLIRLRSLGNDDFEWVTEVDHAIGGLAPSRVDDIARALFAAAERDGGTVRADYRASFPRTTAALGRMFRLDSINTTPQGDGSTLVALHVVTSADGLRGAFPAFAKYVDKYVEPARYRVRLTDARGDQWFDAWCDKQRLVVRFRSNKGELQPLVGSARRMPDSLRVHVDALAKFGLFTVGVTRMEGEFVHLETSTERGWAMRFTQEPKWHLPLIAERLLRAPLQRPFDGPGMTFTLSLRQREPGSTLLSRHFAVAVRESAVMRFLGNLGFGAMSDYAGTVEDEENRFLAETFRAMRADIRGQ